MINYKDKNHSICVIIPARGGSKRLKYKNIYILKNKPLICWSIDACKESKYVDFVCVSTEDNKIKDVVSNYNSGVFIHERDKALSEDKVFKMAAVRSAYQHLNEIGRKFDIIISLQANSPQITSGIIDSAIECFLENERNELISTGINKMQNAAFRIMKNDTVYQRELSTRCGFFTCDLIDVHTIEDLRQIEKILDRRR